MGVLGLTPFIQKICPEAIKRLPDRLQGFSGKRIVLDGTLLTQRFHFAQIPHPYRHVLGWYRLIKELEHFGVEAICVFDGKERNLAKAQETLRRKNTQRQTTARGLIENERLARLNQISTAVSKIEKLSFIEKAQLSSALAHLSPKQPDQQETKDIYSLLKESRENGDWVAPIENHSDDEFSKLMDGWSSKFSHDSSADIPRVNDDALRRESLTAHVPGVVSPPAGTQKPPPPRIPDSELTTIITEAQETSEPPLQASAERKVESKPPESLKDTVLLTLKPLLLEYKKSISKVASIPVPAPKSSTTESNVEPRLDPVEAVAVQEAYEMSKRQHQLTLQEGAFWDNLTSTLSIQPEVPEIPLEVAPEQETAVAIETHQEMLQELTHRSNLISESYRIRTNPPTNQTYAECREILQAMGVSCVECEGPFEAEALASSLVLNGHADYVASEDTDVLIYEVPLIRNITSRQQPLLVISGAELRSMLNLTRSAFVDFALLLGTDFSQRIRQVGPSRALDFIRAHGSIEKVIEVETKYKPKVPREDYMKQINLGRNVFQTLPPIPEDTMFQFGSKIDTAQMTFVMGKYGLSREVEWDSEDALSGNYFDDNPQL